MNRKWFVTVLTILLAIAMATACSSGNSGNESSATGGSSAAPSSAPAGDAQPSSEPTPTTITWWAAWGEDAGPGQIIEKFNEQYPHITVEYVQFSNSDEGNVKIDTSLLAAQEIDVFFNYGAGRFDPRAKAGLLQDLTELMANDGFDGDAEFGELIRHDGKVYGLPVTSLNNAVYLNKKFLDEQGLSVPESWTLDEYKDYAVKLTAGSGANKRYGSTDFHSSYYWTMPARGLLGGDFWYKPDGTSNFDHPAFRQSLAFKYDMEVVEQVQFPFTELATTKVQTFNLFMQEKAAMAVSSNAITRFIKDTEQYPRDFIATVAPLPTLSKDQAVNYNEGIYPFGMLSMSANTKDKDASWTFMKWLGTEGSIYLAQVGHVPTWKNGNKDDIMKIIFGDEPEKVIDTEAFKRVVLNFDAPGYMDTIFDGYGEINRLHQDEADKYLFNTATLDEALDAIKQKADEAIQSAK